MRTPPGQLGVNIAFINQANSRRSILSIGQTPTAGEEVSVRTITPRRGGLRVSVAPWGGMPARGP